MMRRVPARIEAENYGEEGLNKSYFVKNPDQHSRHHDPSPVSVTTDGTNRQRDIAAAIAPAGGWTGYTISSDAPALPGRRQSRSPAARGRGNQVADEVRTVRSTKGGAKSTSAAWHSARSAIGWKWTSKVAPPGGLIGQPANRRPACRDGTHRIARPLILFMGGSVYHVTAHGVSCQVCKALWRGVAPDF